MNGIAHRKGSDARRIGRAMMVVGCLACVGTLVFAIWSALTWGGAQSTVGTIIDYAGGRNTGTIAPVVEYQVAGRTYRITGTGLRFHRYSRGDRTIVLYLDDHPEVAQLGSFADRWFLPLFVLSCASLLTFIGRLISRSGGRQSIQASAA